MIIGDLQRLTLNPSKNQRFSLYLALEMQQNQRFHRMLALHFKTTNHEFSGSTNNDNFNGLGSI